MKRPTLELTAITQGPCEACFKDIWTYRVLETHTPIAFSRTFRWCEECLYLHAEDTLASIYDRLTDKMISIGMKRTASG